MLDDNGNKPFKRSVADRMPSKLPTVTGYLLRDINVKSDRTSNIVDCFRVIELKNALRGGELPS